MGQAFLLDATVYSDLDTPQGGDRRLLAWLIENWESCFVCPLMTMHMVAGVARLEARDRDGDRARALRIKEAHASFLSSIADRFVPLDAATYSLAGEILGRTRLKRQGIEESDCLLAAVATLNKMVIVTRNADDFAATGVPFIDTSKLTCAAVIEADFPRAPFLLPRKIGRKRKAVEPIDKSQSEDEGQPQRLANV